MSTSEGSDRPGSQATFRDPMRWFGPDVAKLAVAGRDLEEIVKRAEARIAAVAPPLVAWGERLNSLSQEPERPGHEKLFMERLGYDRLRARLMTRAVHHFGKLLADEINQGRRVRAIIDKIVKTKDCSTLVISRRAKRFRDECDSDHVAIHDAAKKAGLSLRATEFNQLIEAACQRDEAACRQLGRTAKRLAPHLPEKSGRPISAETCIHVMFLEILEREGMCSGYTYSDIEGGDFVDRATRATRLALKKPRFSPLHANQVRKAYSNRIKPAVLRAKKTSVGRGKVVSERRGPA